MSYTFTITCNTVEEIERLMAAIRHDVDPAVVAQVSDAAAQSADAAPAAAEPPKRRGRPPRERAPEPAAPATTDAANAEAPDTGASEADATPAQQPEPTKEKALTLDDARTALRGLQARIGEDDMATPISLLKEFGASRISEVKPEDYAAFAAACEKAG